MRSLTSDRVPSVASVAETYLNAANRADCNGAWVVYGDHSAGWSSERRCINDKQWWRWTSRDANLQCPTPLPPSSSNWLTFYWFSWSSLCRRQNSSQVRDMMCQSHTSMKCFFKQPATGTELLQLVFERRFCEAFVRVLIRTTVVRRT